MPPCAHVYAGGWPCLAGAMQGRSKYCASHDPAVSARRAVLAKVGTAMKASKSAGVVSPRASADERQYREVWQTIMERGAEWTP